MQKSPTITGCGTIGSDKTTLTAGTSAQFASAQTLENYADTLLNALNGWVNAIKDRFGGEHHDG